MKLVSGIVDSGFFAQSALSAEVATKDSLGRNISETYLTGVDLTPYQTVEGMSAYANSAGVTGTAQYGLTTAGWTEVTAGGGVTGDFTLVEGNGIQLTDDPIAQTTTVSVSGDYATNTQLQTVSADIIAMIPTALTGDYLDKASADTLYYPLNSNPNGYLSAETDWSDIITAASANAYSEATAAIPTGLATTGDLQTVSGEITALIPSTAGLASEDWVTGQGYITNDAITGKQDITGMTAYLTTGDSAEFMTTAERSDYIPTGVSSEFYTTANTANYISEVPDTYLQNTDLTIVDNKITEISGIPLSAGGDVPEGVMVESGLEFNAVNEISGYNGSAIAQYGAEKQWLTHDDTIVHVSNSAQYAFGCNVPVVAQQMGVDETLLFSATDSSGSTAQTITLSEPYTAFKRLRMYYSIDDGDAGMAEILTICNKINCYTQCSQAPIGGICMYKGERYYLVNDNQISASPSASMIYWNNGTSDNTTQTGKCQSYSAFKVHEIYGIGRKENA